MGEFELISHYFAAAPCAQGGEGVALGIGDDCALLDIPAGEQLAISTDTLVAGVHFPAVCDPLLLGQRSLAVAISDLAAMGATAIGFTLALTLPQVGPDWLEGFADGLGRMAHRCGISLIGGDTTRGPLSITVTVFGRVPAGQALRRSGARPGDLLCVGGDLGNAAGRCRWCWASARPSTRWQGRCLSTIGRRCRNCSLASACVAWPRRRWISPTACWPIAGTSPRRPAWHCR